ncbi:hypothetical protein PM082_020247 [Marasmius tenuissimus]|nr:hypothetical protein PM082_020247 [Marasmius tenuissimus]
MAASNIHHGSGTQNNNFSAMGQNIIYSGNQINVGHDLVQRINAISTKPGHLLEAAVAGIGASHTAEQQCTRGTCLRGTRERALEMINEWMARKEKDCPACWLTGAAGVGKTAIAMTVAKSCEKDRLVTSFFFFRSDPKRNNSSGLIPTIAHGLVSTTPFMRSPIHQRISANPRIFEATLEAQFRELIIAPVLKRRWRRRIWSLLSELSITRKVSDVVIIDGLDECSDEGTQTRILSAIRSAFQESPRLPLRFLICSRPEPWIREAFAAEPLCQLSKVINLDVSFSPDIDIRRYYLHHFQEIVKSHRYEQVRFPEFWPSEEDLEALVRRSGGQFAYAVTVVKFVKAAFAHPIEQLHVILDNTPKHHPNASLYPELDALYHVILDANPDRKRVVLILATIFILPPHLDPSPACIELLFGLSSGEVALTLRAMHSVLDIRGRGEKISIYHTSFRDFLTDRDRSRDFHVDVVTQRYEIARQWLQNLSTSKMRTYSFNQLYAVETNLFFLQWIQFCVSIPIPTRELLDNLRNVDLASAFWCRHVRPNPSLGDLAGMSHFVTGVTRRVWPRMFANLCLWMEKYRGQDKVDFEDLMGRFMEHPKCFHLERPESNVSLQDPSVYWAVLFATGCSSPTGLIWRAAKSRQCQVPLLLADCRCDPSRRKQTSDSKHLDYQEACFQLVKALISDSQDAAKISPFSSELYNISENLVDSSLLQHCRVESRLISLCRTYFETAGDHIFEPEDWTKKRRTKLLEWIGTFPPNFAVEAQALKAQVTSLFSAEKEYYRRIS